MDKTFDAAAAEPRIAAAWEAAGAFAAGAGARRDETFCIVIPPPNVTGSLHMGHAFNNTLQDILTRWHRMRGFDTLWQPGMDHAGIATQMVVERELARQGNESRREMGRDKFLEKVWEWKATSGGTITSQLERLGASCDWSRNAFTMAGAPGDTRAGHDNSPDFHHAVLKVFVDFHDRGLIYRGKRLVNWDPHFETAISDLEVENVETDGHFWHFKYPLEGGETYEYVERDEHGAVIFRETRDYISIATTRPETMLGDGAVAVHPSDERYASIVGKRVLLPLAERYIPIITDEYPDPAFGSGAVKITGAHDFNDYTVAMRNDIPLYILMDTKGRMRDDDAADNLVPVKYRGMDRFEARRAVVADIDARGLMIAVEDRKIMQPTGDRSKVVIEPTLTDQWFVDTAAIVQPAIDAVRSGEVKILPEQHEKVYFHWLENIEPWCISRQLWWGHRIPVWYGPNNNFKLSTDFDEITGSESSVLQPFCAATAEEALAKAESYYDGKYELGILEDNSAYFKILKGNHPSRPTGSKPQLLLSRDPDVLDTWFSSGLWPIGTLGWPEDTPELNRYFPTDVLVTGFDIIFFWVARMMMMQYAIVGEKPFHTVYVHALVRDEAGKKMSKSLGNVLDPIELIDEFGADAVRFTLASMAAMGRDLKLSPARVAGYRNFGTKLWNAARFAEMNGVFRTEQMYQTHQMHTSPPRETANRWILGETARVREEVDAALAAYRFNDAANALYGFVWGRVCDWYVEFAKPLLDGDSANETKAVMRWVLEQCLILLHPFMPFVTEELWETTAVREGMLVLIPWPEYTEAELADAEADAEMSRVIEFIEQIRSARGEMNVPAGMQVPLTLLDLDDAATGALDRNTALIRRLARIGEISRAAAAPKGAVTLALRGGSVALPLADIIDVNAERARLEKARAKLAKEMGGLEGRLSNARFLDSAPTEVVAESRELLAQKQAEDAKLKAALDRLAEVA